MNVFIGSSREAKDVLERVALIIEDSGHKPLPWNEESLFIPGDNIWQSLIDISTTVDAAIFIFSEDDKVEYHDNSIFQPRDNVLVEYGLFVGKLGVKRTIICSEGKPKFATDIHGIIYVDIGENNKNRAKIQIKEWLKSILHKPSDANNRPVTFLNQLFRSLEQDSSNSSSTISTINRLFKDSRNPVLFDPEILVDVLSKKLEDWRFLIESNGQTSLIDLVGDSLVLIANISTSPPVLSAGKKFIDRCAASSIWRNKSYEGANYINTCIDDAIKILEDGYPDHRRLP